MERRTFLGVIAGGLLAAPLAAGAQLVNAIKAAIGVRSTELPITPETVHRALAESSSPRPNSMTAT